MTTDVGPAVRAAVPRPGRPLRCTYRLQLHAGFTFDDAAAVIPYLAALGVSHVYTSPILQAAPHSTHGYDVVDHSRINDELGGAEGYARLQTVLAAHGVGHVLDIVPNHMALAGRANAWWWDVLENGPASRHAAAFDIDWAGGDQRSAARVLMPILGDQFGRVLEAGELHLERRDGSFIVCYYDHEAPISPRSLDDLVHDAAARAGCEELDAIATALGALPHARNTNPVAVAERHRGKELLRERLATLLLDPKLAHAVDARLGDINADPDALEALLARQNYRLASWRTAKEELDYRRFFNIETLVGLRVEDPAIFAASHAVVAELASAGAVDELRVDHIDGLRDPSGYLERLTGTVAVPVVVEKILGPDEELPPEWPVAGTTGYEFARRVDGLFVDGDNEAAMTAVYETFVGDAATYGDVVAASKQQIMRDDLRAEVERLTGLLAAVCQRRRRHVDHTRHELRETLRAVLAAFSVYRTYVRPGYPTSATDRARIAAAVERAACGPPDLDAELLTFLGRLLAGDETGGDELELAVRFQQVSSPVMAKGVEDTAFYRYNRLISLNEVGGAPGRFGTSVAEFHRENVASAATHPASMLTLSTHDTKRSGDVRARIHLVSEIPADWARAVADWHELAAAHRSAAGPDRALAYLAYQSLVGAWPVTAERLAAYLDKAAKEAKEHTSWTDPRPAFDEAVAAFARGVVGDPAFVDAVEAFLAEHRLVELGRINAVAQTALLLTAPGVPDIYQGTDVWDLSLVDPDNRRPVDFERRARLLDTVGSVADAVAADADGGPKLWLIRRVLADRAARPDAYADPAYRPIDAAGPKAGHVVAYARRDTVVVVPRLLVGLGGDWQSTTVALPAGRWRDVVTDTTIDGADAVALAQILETFPVAVLARDA
jgi:(1->4)-alpha-D-glucan 1-alpha-D-glucosylmutase